MKKTWRQRTLLLTNSQQHVFICGPCPARPTGKARRGLGGCCACRGSVSQLRSPKLRKPKSFIMAPKGDMLLSWTVSKPVLCSRGRHRLCLPKLVTGQERQPGPPLVRWAEMGSTMKNNTLTLITTLQGEIHLGRYLASEERGSENLSDLLKVTGLRDRIQSLSYFHYLMPLMSDYISPAPNPSPLFLTRK